MEVEVKILDERVVTWGFPSYGSDWAAGLDLFACIDEVVCLGPQDPARLIPAGISVHIGDPGWCGLVLPRSGLGHKSGLILGNAVGLVDPDYSGQCMISAWNRNPIKPNTSDDEWTKISPGDRIAQLVFTRFIRPNFKVVKDFTSPRLRGEGGFGSTGVAPPTRAN